MIVVAAALQIASVGRVHVAFIILLAEASPISIRFAFFFHFHCNRRSEVLEQNCRFAISMEFNIFRLYLVVPILGSECTLFCLISLYCSTRLEFCNSILCDRRRFLLAGLHYHQFIALYRGSAITSALLFYSDQNHAQTIYCVFSERV